MSGFNKRSRLAPQGSGKTPEPGKDSSKEASEQSTANAKAVSGAAKPTNKKLQWSMGDLLNKLENPETPLADAKASIEPAHAPKIEAESPPPKESPAKKATQVSKEPVRKEKQPERSPLSEKEASAEPAQEPAPVASTETAQNIPTEPEWSVPSTAPAPEWELSEPAAVEQSWSSPAKPSADEPWATPQGPFTPSSEDKTELWGKPDSQESGPLWGAPTQVASTPDLWAATDNNSVELWAAGTTSSEAGEKSEVRGHAEPSQSPAESWAAESQPSIAPDWSVVTSVTDITEPPINFASDASPALDADDLSVNGEWDEPITVGIGTAPPAPPNVDSVEAEPTASEETALSMSDWDEPSTARLQTDWQEPSVSESFGQDSFEARADEAEEGAVKESEPQPLPAVASLDGETVGTTAAVEPPARTPLEETPSSVSSLEKPELPAAEIATTNDTVSEPHSIDRTAATEPSQDSSTAEPAQPKPPELTYRKSALGEAAALVKKAMAKKLATSRSEEAVSAVKRSDAEPTKSSSTEAAPEPGPGPSEPAENVLFTPGDEAGSSSKSPEAEATESSSTEVLPESGPGPSEPAENVLFTPGDEAGSSSKSPEAEATESSSTEVLPESGPGPSEPAENVLFSLGKEAGGAAKIDLKEQLETGTFNIKSFGMESKKQPKPFNVVNTDKIANAAKSEKVLKSLKAMAGDSPVSKGAATDKAQTAPAGIEPSASPGSKLEKPLHDAVAGFESASTPGLDTDVQHETGMFKINPATLEHKIVSKVDRSIQQRLLHDSTSQKPPKEPTSGSSQEPEAAIIKPTRKVVEHEQSPPPAEPPHLEADTGTTKVELSFAPPEPQSTIATPEPEPLSAPSQDSEPKEPKPPSALESPLPTVPGSPPSQFGKFKPSFDASKILESDLTKRASVKSSLSDLNKMPTREQPPADTISTPLPQLSPEELNKIPTPKVGSDASASLASAGVSASELNNIPTPKVSPLNADKSAADGVVTPQTTRASSPFQASRAPTLALRSKVSTHTNRQNQIIIGASALLLLATVAWFASAFQQKSALISQLENQYNTKQFADAQATVDRALELYPNDAIFHFYNGRLLLMRAKTLEALPELTKALSSDPNNVDMLIERAKLYFVTGQYSETVLDLDRVVEGKQFTGETFALRAKAEMRLGNHMKAMEDFQKAIQLEPKKPDLYADRAEALVELHLYKDSIKDWDLVMSQEPANPEGLARKALAEYKASESEKSKADFEKSISMKPTAMAYFLRGLTKADENKLPAAKSDFNKALSLDPNNLAIVQAKTQSEHGAVNFDKALDDFNVLENSKGATVSAGSLEITAEVAMSAGRYQQAEDAYAKLLADKPNDSKLRLAHAAAAEHCGDFAKATEDYSTLLNAEPNNLGYYVKRGALYTKERRYQLANEDFDRAISMNENYADAYLMRAIDSQAQGLYPHAQVDLEHVLKLQPNNEPAKKMLHELMAKLHSTSGHAAITTALPPPKVSITGDAMTDGYKLMIAGELERAIANFARAIKKNPNDATVRRYMAYCLLENGQPAEAVGQFKALETLGSLKPEDEDKYFDCLSKCGRTDDVIAKYKKKLLERPGDARSRMALAKIYESNGDTDTALKVLSEGMTSSSPSDAQQLQEMQNTIKDAARKKEEEMKATQSAPKQS